MLWAYPSPKAYAEMGLESRFQISLSSLLFSCQWQSGEKVFKIILIGNPFINGFSRFRMFTSSYKLFHLDTNGH